MLKEVIRVLHVFFIYVISSIVASDPSISLKCVDTLGCTLLQDTYVFCVNLNLSIIPLCVENVQVLDLSYNFLQRLRGNDFSADSFGPLEVLLLRNVSMKLIEEDALASLNNLRQLDLSVNLLKSFYPRTFAGNSLLERLNLSTNLIKKLPPNQFNLPKLKMLDLSNGFLEYVNEAAFANLPALQWLNLKDNKLKTLPSFEVDVPHLLLGGNPWSCDCTFYWFSQKCVDPLEDDFRCTDTERNRRLWNETTLSAGDCEEQVDGKQKIIRTGARKGINASKLDKNSNSRTENSPRVIIDIYGYVLLGIGILVFLCCCCDGQRSTISIGWKVPVSSTISNSLSGSSSGRISMDARHPTSAITSVDNYYTDGESHLSNLEERKGPLRIAHPAKVSSEALDYVDVLIHKTTEKEEK